MEQDKRMADPTVQLTLQLPQRTVQRLQQLSRLSGRPVDELVADTLKLLPPSLEDAPPDFQVDLARLEAWPSDKLRAQVYAQMGPDQVARYDDLLHAFRTDGLDASGQQELSQLKWEADSLMLRKAYAALLLKWRGEPVPTLTELEASV